jgi:hypothetical protein
MTNRDRLLRTLACQPADHAPFVWWLGFSPWAATSQRWQSESGLSDLNPETYFGFAPFSSMVWVEYGPYPHFEQALIEETPEFITARDWRGIVTRNRRDMGSMPEFLLHPVATRTDWERYKAERLQPRLDERLAGLDQSINSLRKIDAPVQVGAFPWGLFGTLRDLLGPERAFLSFYTDPGLVHDIMASYTTLWLSLYEAIAARIQIDHVHIWEDMAGKQGSLISLCMVEEFMMPHYDQIAAFCRNHQVPVFSVDSDGNVADLVPRMMRHGVNAFLPFEAQAGADVERCRVEYPGLGLLGGLDKNALIHGGADLRRELDRAGRLLAQGGWVPGFDHLIPPDVPWKHYCEFVGELKKLIGI